MAYKMYYVKSTWGKLWTTGAFSTGCPSPSSLPKRRLWGYPE
jgi:hypothetical protein